MCKNRFLGKFRGQKGSVTLFILISIIFFLIVSISIYISNKNKEQAQVSEIQAIQDDYNVSKNELQKEYEKIVDANDGTYSIKYILNGGIENTNPSSYTEEDEDIVLNNPTKKGYTFTGWTGTNLTSPSKNVVIPTGSKGDRTYEANWRANTYTVAFDGNGATSGSMSNLAMTYDKSNKLPSNSFLKEGYEFKGWTTSKNSSDIVYADEAEINNLTDIDGELVKLYAVWGINQYTLTIDPNGGKYADSEGEIIIKGDYNSTIELGDIISPEGSTVTFDGNGGSTPESLTSEMIFKEWQVQGEGSIEGSEFTFGAGDGKIIAQYEDQGIILPNSNKDGYTVEGWYNEDGEKVGEVGDKYVPDGDEKLTVSWTANSYTIVLDGNNATSGNTVELDMIYDEPQELPEKPFTRDGYEFIGWSSDKDAISPEYNDGDTVNNLTIENNGTVTLYALWKKTIIIKYDANGGDGEPGSQSGTMYNSTVSVDIKLSSTIPTRTGYTFSGWTDGKGSAEVKYRPGETYSFSESTTLYAVWGANNYVLTVDPNGGTWNGKTEVSRIPGDYESTITIENPTPPAGYTITFDANGGKTNQTSVKSTKYFSNWRQEGSGILEGTNFTFGATETTLTANYGDNSVDLPLASRDGYVCDGWYTSPTGGEKRGDSEGIYTPSQEETLYAQWIANTYTIVLNGNGATSGEMSNLNMTYDIAQNLPLNTYTKTGYTFVGWSTDKDETKLEYADGAEVKNLTTNNEGTVTLYAIWRKTITITYNANGGSGAPGVQTGDMYNSAASVEITLSNTKPTKEGYSFDGWTDVEGATEVKYQAGGKYQFSNNTTLYAVWKANSYNLTVNPSGGTWNNTSSNSTIPGDYGTTTQIANPTPPTGYKITFNGNNGTPSQASMTSTKSFANWTEEGPGSLNGTTYTYGAGDGKLTANYKDDALTLPTATRTGYTCSGWYTAASGGTKRGDAGGSYTPTEEETLYAHWTANTYKVVFNGNGATSGSMSDQTMTYDVSANLTTNAFTRTGYEFFGWSTNASATTATYTDGQSVNNLSSTNGETVNLYALWRKTITINYNANGGSGAPGASTGTLYNAAENVRITLSNTKPTREGYEFLGWSTSQTATIAAYQPNTAYLFSENTTLYAVWSTNAYILTVNPNGGRWNNTENTSEITGDYQETTAIANPTPPTGYTITFNGNNGTSSQTSATSTKSFTNWTEEGPGSLNGTTYTFGAGDGTLTANYKDDALALPTATREGYTCSGWYTAASGGTKRGDAGGSYTPTAAETLYAHWTANTYKVVFNGNGATSGSMSDQTMTYGQSANLRSNGYSKSGYVFQGWGTSSTDTSVEYTNGQSVSNLTSTNGGTVNLYAIWRKTITITYNANGGSGAPGVSTGNMYNSAANVSIKLSDTKPTRTGYTFSGWSTSQTADTADYQPGTSYPFDENTTLYAVWSINSYYVDLNIYIDGTKYGTSTDNPVYARVIVDGVDKGYRQDYYIQHEYGTEWEVDGLRIDGVDVAYTASGTVGTSGVNIRLDFYTVTFASNNTNYGTVTPTTYIVPKGATYSTSGTTLTINDGRKVTATVKNVTGYTTTVSSWSPSSGTVNAATTVTANFSRTANTYTIKFNGNGATSGSMADLSMTYGTAKNLTTNAFTRTGYTFFGWSTDASATTATYTDGQSVSNLASTNGETVNLYALWRKTVTISYEANGGSGAPGSHSSYMYNAAANVSIALSSTKPTREGYTFLGWSTDKGATSAAYAAGGTYSFSNSATLYAVWKINQYTLTINPNGGTYNNTTSATEIKRNYNETITISNPTPPAGYTVKFDGNGGTAGSASLTSTKSFSGWTQSGNGTLSGTKYTFCAGNDTLTANYKNNEITLPNATRTGYTFDGWYTSSTGGTKVGDAGKSYTPDATTTLYAHWTINEYVLTVDPNGGSWRNGSYLYDIEMEYGSVTTIENPTPPSGYGIVFNGNGGTPSQDSIRSTKSFDSWTKEGAGTLNGTTYTFGAGNATLTANYRDNTLSLPTATRTGYTCSGWYTAASGGTKRGDAGGSYTPTAAETLYAHWTANTYKIVFNGNGATSGSMSDQTMTYGQSANLKSNGYSKSGYVFQGWGTSSSDTSVNYSNGQSVSNLTSTNGGTVNLYAIWKKTITISYNANGGSGAPGSQTGTMYNTATSTSITLSGTKPTRSGYIFQGWGKSSGTSTVSYSPGGKYSFSNSTTLYAVWKLAIAQIGSTLYPSLASAVSAVPTNKVQTTITMLQNTKESVTIAANKNVKLNVNSKTITGASGSTITNRGTLQVYGGTIKNPSTANSTIGNYGTLSITSGTISSSNNYALNNWSGGKITITGSSTTISGTSGVQTIYNQSKATLTIAAGKFTASKEKVLYNKGSATIYGGTFTTTRGDRWTIYNPAGSLLITGGTFTLNNSSGGASNSNGTAVFTDGGAFDIRGGTINSIAYGLVVRYTSGAKIRSTTIQSSNANYPAICSYDIELDIYKCTIKNTGSSTNGTAVLLQNPSNNQCAIRLYDCATSGKMSNGIVLVNKNNNGYQVRLFPRISQQPSSARIATWTTANGQDDLKWKSMSKYSTTGSATGSAFRYNVLKSDHRNATGEYTSHIYVTVNGSEYLFTGFTYTI